MKQQNNEHHDVNNDKNYQKSFPNEMKNNGQRKFSDSLCVFVST